MVYLQKAIDTAGGVTQFASGMGVSKPTVYTWLGMGGVPLEKALEVEMRFGVSALRVMNRAGILGFLANEKVGTPDAILAAKHGCGCANVARVLRECGWDSVGPVEDVWFEDAFRAMPGLSSIIWDGQEYMSGGEGSE